MPTSDWHGISDIVTEIVRLAPQSVLDLGCGFGMWGALCRNYLDGAHGRIKRESWECFIAGAEAFKGYENPLWDVYHQVHIFDFTEWDRGLPLRTLGIAGMYDLVLMIDSLEHLQPDVGRRFIGRIVRQNKHVIVSVPNGPMEQGAAFGNEYERHRWTFNGVEEFAPYKFKLIHQSVCTVVSIEGGS